MMIMAVWRQIRIDIKRYLVGSVYCKPESMRHDSFLGAKRTNEQGKRIQSSNKFNSIVIYNGDFNTRPHDWGDHLTTERGKKLPNYAESNDLTTAHSMNVH